MRQWRDLWYINWYRLRRRWVRQQWFKVCDPGNHDRTMVKHGEVRNGFLLRRYPWRTLRSVCILAEAPEGRRWAFLWLSSASQFPKLWAHDISGSQRASKLLKAPHLTQGQLTQEQLTQICYRGKQNSICVQKSGWWHESGDMLD